MEGTDGRTDGRTDGTEHSYIPLQLSLTGDKNDLLYSMFMLKDYCNLIMGYIGSL